MHQGFSLWSIIDCNGKRTWHLNAMPISRKTVDKCFLDWSHTHTHKQPNNDHGQMQLTLLILIYEISCVCVCVCVCVFSRCVFCGVHVHADCNESTKKEEIHKPTHTQHSKVVIKCTSTSACTHLLQPTIIASNGNKIENLASQRAMCIYIYI